MARGELRLEVSADRAARITALELDRLHTCRWRHKAGLRRSSRLHVVQRRWHARIRAVRKHGSFACLRVPRIAVAVGDALGTDAKGLTARGSSSISQDRLIELF